MSTKIIDKQIKLIEKIKTIGESQQLNIDKIGGITVSDSKENHKRAIALNVKKLYIENYWDYINFFIEKLKTERDESFKYYIPLIRTLLEIYTELLYFSNLNINEQVLLGSANHLFTLAKNIQVSQKSPNKQGHKELVEAYNDFYRDMYDLIKNKKISSNPLKLSSKFMKRNGLNFPPKEEILKPKYTFFKNCSAITRKLFPAIKPSNIYDIYRRYSDYVHGNIYSLMKRSDSRINEKFWIIAELQLVSVLMVELCNRKITIDSHNEELSEWIRCFQEERPNFKWLWFNKKLGVV